MYESVHVHDRTDVLRERACASFATLAKVRLTLISPVNNLSSVRDTVQQAKYTRAGWPGTVNTSR